MDSFHDAIKVLIISFLMGHDKQSLYQTCHEFRRLIRLIVTHVKPTSFSEADIDYILEHFPSFYSLSFENFRSVTDIDFVRVHRLQMLTKLDVSHCTNITNAILPIIGQLTRLQSFDMSYTRVQFNNENMQQIGNLKLLKSLNLRNCTTITNAILPNIGQLTRLQSLDLSCCNIRFENDNIHHIGNLKLLESLNLSENGIMLNYDMKIIAQLSMLQTLTLDIQHVSNKGLIKLGKLTRLQHLELYMCHDITDDGMDVLNSLSHLRSLILSESGITDASLSKLTNIQKLDLFQSDITDDGLLILSRMTTLYALNISYCENITDTGLQHLTALHQLNSLDISLCDNITDESLLHLTTMSKLNSLNINRCNNITNTGLMHLLVLDKLTSLDVSECENITENGLAYLMDLMPNLEVITDN